MVWGRSIFLVVALTAPSLATAQTISFGEGAAILGKSCAPDITANCRGVNIDSTRLKECLYRNQDVMSAACKADYPRAFDAIQKRIAARATVGRECEFEVVKKCGGKGREVFKSLNCLLALPTVSARCTKSIADVGYRATDEVATKLSGLETPLELDIPALRAQVLERSKLRGKNEPPPQKRPPIAPELNKLPSFNIDIQFDTDTPIVRPESYQTIGRLADTLVNAALLNYTFLIVGHVESTGRRDHNVYLSQRRADAIRDILVNTFKISAKRLQSVGLGEEQLLDPARPNGPVNAQTQIMTLAKVPEQSDTPAAAKGAAAKKPAKKKK
ncbi:OmpA family protein [Bradyrhizobium sp. LjRoot220]|uniref:OmpA family protein n=1 Tax=Bradyrhizobium sp. LjRoot220 TaxID=3342284 RepID=UPI003F4FF6F6